MANEKLAYELSIKTRAEGDGTRRATQGMNEVAAATTKATSAAHNFLTAAEAEVAEVERLVNAARRLRAEQDAGARPMRTINQFLRDTADNAKVASIAYYDLNEKIQRTGNTSSGAGGKAKNLGVIFQQAGYQVGDFAVQVQAGTSAVTAFSQQAPQFLGVFGPGGAIAGAAVALGGVVLGTLLRMREGAKETAQAITVDFDQIAQNAGDRTAEALRKARDEIDSSMEASDALKLKFDETNKAQNSYATSVLSNSEEIAQAFTQLNELLGIRVDRVKALEDAELRAKKKREEAAAQQLEAEKRRVQDADEALMDAEYEFQKRSEISNNAKADLATAIEKLEILRKQRDELEKISKIREDPEDPGLQILGSFAPGLLPKSQEAKDASLKLDTGVIQTTIKALEKQIDVLNEQISEDVPAVQGALNRLNRAQIAKNDIDEAVQIRMEEISTNLEVDNQTAALDGLVQRSQLAADQLDAFIAEITPTTDRQVAAKDAIKEVTADGQVTAEETLKATEALRELSRATQTSITNLNSNAWDLIKLVNDLQNEALMMRPEIDRLKANQQKLDRRQPAPPPNR